MRIAALTYHDVSSAPPKSGAARRYTVSPDRFAAHLDALETAPGRVVDLRGDERAVLLTFDDGDASAATTVAPLLASRGWPAHFFIVTSWIGEPGRLNADGIRRL